MKITPKARAFHSSDVPQIFGNTAKLMGVADTADEVRFSKMMREAWAGFAKDPENALWNMGWPTYDPEGNTLVQLALNESTTVSFAKSTQYD